MKRFLCLITLFALASGAQAVLPASLYAAPEVQSILSNNCIRIETRGRAAANFADLLSVNRRPDLLQAVQREYAAMMPEGKAPEFEIQETAPGAYFYLNAKNQESRLTELLRELQPDGKLHAVYAVSGERFFGDFQALVHIAITDESSGNVSYEAEVYAWPENQFIRGAARGLRFAIESFFNSKTRYMTGLVLDICARLVEDPRLASAQ
jgi:hypothetical protein